MQITDLQQELTIPALLRLAFRPFFLVAALFGCLSIASWGLLLAGVWRLPLQVDPLFWHSHEMLFGFVAAAIAGFLLTAVQNWSGQRGVHGTQLALLVLLWLLGRIAPFLAVPSWLQALCSLLFLPSVALVLAIPVLRAKLYRNLFFVPVLALLTLCSGLMWLAASWQDPLLQQHAARSAVLLITMLMLVIGGRVLPGFTANGLAQPLVKPLPWLQKAALGVAWVVTLLELTGLSSRLPVAIPATLALIAGGLNFARWLRLRPWQIWRVPLLWSLHFAYGSVCLGFVLLAASEFGLVGLSRALVLHVFTVAGMGLMILSMMTRVSLGHSGRPLQPSRWMSIAFVLVFAAALARVLWPMLSPSHTLSALSLAAACWSIGYAVFVGCYLPILIQPRADGRPG